MVLLSPKSRISLCFDPGASPGSAAGSLSDLVTALCARALRWGQWGQWGRDAPRAVTRPELSDSSRRAPGPLAGGFPFGYLAFF